MAKARDVFHSRMAIGLSVRRSEMETLYKCSRRTPIFQKDCYDHEEGKVAFFVERISYPAGLPVFEHLVKGFITISVNSVTEPNKKH